MKIANSEVFDNYAKIALDSGLIKNADEEKESSGLKKYKNDVYPRAGSDDITTIEALYGVKSDSSIEYEYNIMEAAHPRPVIISPSYDKLMGLVENNIEQNNIMCNIALTPNNGYLDKKKYAQNELLMSLVRIANDMDNRNQDELRKIADVCIVELAETKKIKKVAFWPIVIAAASALAILWATQHMDYSNDGLKANLDRAIAKLDGILQVDWFESEPTPEFKQAVNKLRSILLSVKHSVNDFTKILTDHQAPKTLTDTQALNTLADNSTAIKDTLDKFTADMENILPAVNQAIEDYKDQSNKLQRNWASEFLGQVGDAIYGGEKYSLIANDIKKAQLALETLRDSMAQSLKTVNEIEGITNTYAEDIQEQNPTFGKEKTKEYMIAPSKNIEKMPKYEEPDTEMQDMENIIGRKPNKEEADFMRSLFQRPEK